MCKLLGIIRILYTQASGQIYLVCSPNQITAKFYFCYLLKALNGPVHLLFAVHRGSLSFLNGRILLPTFLLLMTCLSIFILFSVCMCAHVCICNIWNTGDVKMYLHIHKERNEKGEMTINMIWTWCYSSSYIRISTYYIFICHPYSIESL